MPVKIFFCYAHEDEALLNKLKAHLRPLQRMGLIDVWYDRDIKAGTKWEEEIDRHLNEANIILLLVSPDFMDSDYCYGKEMQRALERDQRGEARVIPIILRPVYWQDMLGNIQALPTDAKPIMSSSWQYPDEAYLNVVEGIRKVVMQLATHPAAVSLVAPGDIQQETTTPSILTLAALEEGNKSPFLSSRSVEKHAPLHSLTGHTAPVLSVALSADGQTLVSGSEDQTIKVWNLSTGQLVSTLTGNSTPFPTDRRNTFLSRMFEGHTAPVLSVALSANGQTLVSGSEDQSIKVWDLSAEFSGGQSIKAWYHLPANRPVPTITGHTAPVLSVALSADGQTLVSGSEDQLIKVWNLSTNRLMRTLTGHTAAVLSVALSADGQTLVSGSEDQSIKVWDLSTGQLVHTFSDPADALRKAFGLDSNAVRTLALSADGQTLVSGSEDQTIKVWDLSTGQLVRTLTGHTTAVLSVALSADGQTLVSGSKDRTIRVWNLSTNRLMRILTDHTAPVLSVALSTDGQTLVSGSEDRTIKVWRM